MTEEQETSIRVRGAISGNPESLTWVIDHFSPLLMTQARYRLSRHLRVRFDPEDLVQQVWAVCLPKLVRIEPRDGRATKVLVRFLSETLLRIHNGLIARNLTGKPKPIARGENPEKTDVFAGMQDETLGVVSRCFERERARAVQAALEALPDIDRQVLVLHGIEQLPYKILAVRLDLSEGALVMRYRRALDRLAGAMPESILEELRDP